MKNGINTISESYGEAKIYNSKTDTEIKIIMSLPIGGNSKVISFHRRCYS